MSEKVEFVSEHDFNYDAFDHDVIFIGSKGIGKTTLSQEALIHLQNIPYWIWDFSNKYDNYGKVVNDINDLEYGQFVVQEHDKSKKRYGEFLDLAKKFDHMVVITDELHQYTTKNEVFRPLYDFVLSYRNKGLTSWFITTRTQSVPSYILGNLSHIYAMRLKLQSDIDWLQEYIGTKAWLLLPKDKRWKYFVNQDDIDILPKRSYIYRNLDEEDSVVVVRDNE